MNDEYLTTKEVAKLIKASEIWIRQLVSKKMIPSYKIGKKRLFKKEEIDQWINSQRDEAKAAIR